MMALGSQKLDEVVGLIPRVQWNLETQWWVLGVFLATTASFVTSLGVNLQKLAHIKNPSVSYWLSPVWTLGMILVVLASFLDFIALGFAPQTAIAVLGSLTLVANLLFAPIVVKETVTASDVRYTCLILAGTAMSVTLASHREPVRQVEELFALFLAPRFIAYGCFVLLVISFMWFRVHTLDNTPANLGVRRFLYAALAGTIGAQNILFAKCLATMLVNWVSRSTSPASASVMLSAQTYIITLCLASTLYWQVVWMNEGLAEFDALYILPVFQSFWVFGSTMSGLIFFAEYQAMTVKQLLGFSCSVILTTVGVYCLSLRSPMKNTISSALEESEPLLSGA